MTDYKATSANIHNSEMLNELLYKNEDGGQSIHAGSALSQRSFRRSMPQENIEKVTYMKRVFAINR